MRFLMLALVLIAITSCSAIQLNPGAENVRIGISEPLNCNMLGAVTGNQGNWFFGPFTSNENLEEGARNDLLNNAQELGGNYVTIASSRASAGVSVLVLSQVDTTFSGIVFACPDRPDTKVSKATSASGEFKPSLKSLEKEKDAADDFLFKKGRCPPGFSKVPSTKYPSLDSECIKE